MGLELGGCRIVIEAEDRKGLMAEISRLFFDLGVNILSTSTFFRGNQRLLVFRVRTDDSAGLERVLTDKGYKIAGPERFELEWS
jgi:acetoin utilization protein AcuB